MTTAGQILPFDCVLSEEESRVLETVDIYVSDVEPKETERVIKFLENHCPRDREILCHAKRIKKISHDKGFTLAVLICSVEIITMTELTTLINNHNLGSTLKPRIQQICKYPAITRTQFDEWRKLWPINFREDPRRETKFTLKEIELIKQYMENAIQLSSNAKSKGELPIGCILVDPKKNIILSEVIDTRNSTKNPLRHAVLNCIDDIASLERSNCVKKSNKIEVPRKRTFNEVTIGDDTGKDDVEIILDEEDSAKQRENVEGAYLCKGYDVFVTHEPCIMCSMALVHSRVRRVFYGRSNTVSGGLGSCYKIHTHNSLNHHFKSFKGLSQHKIDDLPLIDC
ncbi:6515_t:CDS:2 [Funneliformis geosporum]|uniref:17758_t:CDS:1 n=1 Tax=Funneliformis geosporum TaxID=1117311 RepID=A0A9W4SG17_9GLOM|nr:6515_t:CDS:2 [Funneliformis geosporum]CAI2168223.1 17758_t:CDS:2 [Funneliformis geosporum]